MNCAAIVYHANASALYEERWIERCVRSIHEQTFQDYGVYEVAYDGSWDQIFPDSEFESVVLDDYATAMNYLLEWCFLGRRKYDVVFNINVDDFYDRTRFERQLEAVAAGAQLVSSDYAFVDGDDNVLSYAMFSSSNIAQELQRGHNVICHPVVAYTREFWQGCSRYDPLEVPQEDLQLWKREVGRFKFTIVPEVLAYYRVHVNNVGSR